MKWCAILVNVDPWSRHSLTEKHQLLISSKKLALHMLSGQPVFLHELLDEQYFQLRESKREAKRSCLDHALWITLCSSLVLIRRLEPRVANRQRETAL